jgi:hypothetical protein
MALVFPIKMASATLGKEERTSSVWMKWWISSRRFVADSRRRSLDTLASTRLGYATGHPVDLDPIFRAVDAHGLSVMEYAAEAHGERYKGQRQLGWEPTTRRSWSG